MSVSQLLKDWDLENLIEIFAENDIDNETFMKLNNQLIKELIPKIGPRLKFMEKYDLYLQQNVDEQNTPNVSSPASTLSTESEVCSDASSTPSIATLKTQNSFYGIDEHNALCNPVESMNLSEALKSGFLGTSILTYYKKNNTFDRKTRANLVDLIIKYVFQSYNSHLNVHQLKLLGKKIIELFPNECLETYYVDPVYKSSNPSGRSLPAKGKLVDKYRNCRNKLRSAGLLSSPEPTSEEVFETSETHRNSKSWLITRTEPWEEVITHWNNTFELRRNFEGRTVTSFIDEWPILKDSRSYCLIDIDYEKLFSDNRPLTFVNWATFFEKIFEVQSREINADNELVHLLKEELPRNSQVYVQLRLLSVLVPPKGRSRKGKKHWKPSILESQEGIVCYVNTPARINELIRAKIAEKAEIGSSIQPYIIVEGSDLKLINKAYVVVDELRYEFDDLLRALEVCFRYFHVVGVSYPAESNHIWHLLQWGLFCINTKWDRPIPYIMDIVHSVK